MIYTPLSLSTFIDTDFDPVTNAQLSNKVFHW